MVRTGTATSLYVDTTDVRESLVTCCAQAANRAACEQLTDVRQRVDRFTHRHAVVLGRARQNSATTVAEAHYLARSNYPLGRCGITRSRADGDVWRN